MSKPLYRKYDNSKRSSYKSQREKYLEQHPNFNRNTDNDKPKYGINLSPKSKTQKRNEIKQKRKFANQMKDKSTRIKRCIERRTQNEKEEYELLTKGQEEVRAELKRRGLMDEYGREHLENLNVNTGYHKDIIIDDTHHHIIPSCSEAWEMDNSPVEFRGTYFHKHNMQIHKERVIADTIKEEGQAVMIINPRLEHTDWSYYHKNIEHYERPREDFVYHKVIPPEQAITIHPELIGVQYRGKEAISFSGVSLPWNKQKAAIEIRDYIFYQECKNNPDIIWMDNK